MKRLLAGVLLAARLAGAQAEDAVPASAAVAPSTTPRAALQVLPDRLGYAVDQPPILIRQRLFGLAHGLSLLAAACLDLPEHSGPIQDAYATWHRGQGKAIEGLAQDLARYYFGSRAAEAQWPDLARALNLADSIAPALGTVSLQDACASLPEAIRRPRYELDRLLLEDAEPAQKDALAASPAPTVEAGPREGGSDDPKPKASE